MHHGLGRLLIELIEPRREFAGSDDLDHAEKYAI